MSTALWWIRRDLRLSDNQALTAALKHADQVLPVFILDPTLLSSPHASQKRLAFLLDGLRRLDAALRRRGSRLIVRRGDPLQTLAGLLVETQGAAIFAQQDYSPYARRRDARVNANDDLPLHLVGGLTIQPPGNILKTDDQPYSVFTPFSRRWKALTTIPTLAVLPAPDHIPTPKAISGQEIPQEPLLPPSVPFPSGETEAQRRLAEFVYGGQTSEVCETSDVYIPLIYRYAETRNRPDLDGTSGLSPYLRFGMLSARQAVVTALAAIEGATNSQARQGAETWLDELIWREFYVHILHHFPHVLGRSFRPAFQNIAWQNDAAAFEAWCRGRTGYPIVDAAMRQLEASGWMHNRARMIVASFLVKDLLIDWRWGERWFMQHLVDGDPASNNGGWQWAAGTGTDAAPYFRVFNPTLQSQKFDPDGVYIRRWLPELRDVPQKYIHEPWRMPPEVQRASGCTIGGDYPAPIVDHKESRERALAAYQAAKSGAKP